MSDKAKPKFKSGERWEAGYWCSLRITYIGRFGFLLMMTMNVLASSAALCSDIIPVCKGLNNAPMRAGHGFVGGGSQDRSLSENTSPTAPPGLTAPAGIGMGLSTSQPTPSLPSRLKIAIHFILGRNNTQRRGLSLWSLRSTRHFSKWACSIRYSITAPMSSPMVDHISPQKYRSAVRINNARWTSGEIAATYEELPIWPVWVAVGLFAIFVVIVIWNTFFRVP